MKALSFLLKLVVIGDWVSKLHLLDANEQLWIPKTNYITKRQLRFGNYGDYQQNTNGWLPVYGFYDPKNTPSPDIALFNATPTANDMSSKFQVMYFAQKKDPQEYSTQALLVSSPFLFYKLLLPRTHPQNGLETLAYTGAHSFPIPTETPPAAENMTISSMNNMTTPVMNNTNMPSMNNAIPSTTNYIDREAENIVQKPTNCQFANDRILIDNYRFSRPSNYQPSTSSSAYINPGQFDVFANHNFAQLSYLQNYPQTLQAQFFQQSPALMNSNQITSRSMNNVQSSALQFNDRYLPIKPFYIPTNKNVKIDYLQAPFTPSPFMGLSYGTPFLNSQKSKY